jgi:acyl-CoA thioester hydrolase
MYTKFECSIQILEQHLDSFGHVNNARYFDLYEQARWDFITKFGYGLKEVIENEKGPVVLDVNCRFKRELINREVVTIRSQTIESSGKIMKIYQEIIKENGKVASDATFTFGFMDLKERKLMNPPDSWLKAVGIIS